MATRDGARAQRWWAFPVLAVAVTGGALLPSATIPPISMAVHAVALVVVALVLRTASRRGRGVDALPRWVLAAIGVLTAAALAQLVAPGSPPERSLALTAHAVALALLVHQVLRGERWRAWAQPHAWTDAVMLVVGIGFGVAQVLSAAVAAGHPALAVVTAGVDVTLASALVLFRSAREALAPPVRLLLGAGVLCSVHDLIGLLAGEGPATFRGFGGLLAPLAVVLLALAALHPQQRGPEHGDPAGRPRSGAARLHLVLPVAAVPLLTWLSGLSRPEASLPAWVLHVGGAVITVTALWRAVRLAVDAEESVGRDALTGLLDRRGLMRRLEGAAAGRRHDWLCLVDLDDFKLVNDQRGHEAGDALLVAVAGRLVGELPAEAVVARLGGDELVVLLPAPSAQDAATRVLETFSRPFPLSGEGDAVRVSASVGVTQLGSSSGTAAALVCADVAMYVAKRRGRDRWVAYDPSLREQVLGAGQVQRELRVLLQGREGAGGPSGRAPTGPADAADAADRAAAGVLVVHYQPVVDLLTGRPSGVEALVRWHHPRRGTVPPDSFLALAEAAGLGAALDRWVLHQAMHQVASWDAQGLVDLGRVGVNLGVSSLRSPSLGEDVARALSASGTTPERLLLEITEHDELQADRAAAEGLLRLRDAGVVIALDDFGAGYASIGYLRRWPVNTIKLDRSLLPRAVEAGAFEAVDDPAELLDGVAALAGALGHDLIAEGIETEDDERAVRAVGVRYVQGWRYAPALLPDDLAAWWREHTGPAQVPASRGGLLEDAR